MDKESDGYKWVRSDVKEDDMAWYYRITGGKSRSDLVDKNGNIRFTLVGYRLTYFLLDFGIYIAIAGVLSFIYALYEIFIG